MFDSNECTPVVNLNSNLKLELSKSTADGNGVDWRSARIGQSEWMGHPEKKWMNKRSKMKKIEKEREREE